METRTRLDTELVRRGLARSRTQAGRLIGAGRVAVDGRTVSRAAATLTAEQELRVASGAQPDFASRAGHKLTGALDAFIPLGLRVRGRRCLDAGASTGGFTDVLLRRGAAGIVAVDVGTGQLDPSLAADERVQVRDETNVRHLVRGDVEPAPELVVADLSFISLTLVLPALVAVMAPDADLVLMVKPQFEVGRERIGASGVVRSADLRGQAVHGVLDRARELRLQVHGVTPSPLPGPSGNHEYFVWLSGSAVLGGDAPPGAVDGRSGRPVLDDAAVIAAVTAAVAAAVAAATAPGPVVRLSTDRQARR